MRENILLREIEKHDLLIINTWRNNKRIIDQLGSVFRFINHDTDVAWYENYLKNRSTTIRLVIECLEKKQVIGAIYLTNIDYASRNAELALWIGNEDYQGRGIGYYAVNELLKHAFNNINLHRIYLTVLEKNYRAKNLYKKCGFSQEGVLRDAVYKNGSYQSLELMAILHHEYDSQ